MTANRASLPAVTAAGIVAIIFGLFGALVSFLGGIGILFLSSQLSQSSEGRMPPIAPAIRFMMVGTMLFMLALSVFGIFVGVGILRRRNWARITILIWGGIMAFFCLIAVAFALVFLGAGGGIDLPNAGQVDPVQAMAFTKLFLVIFYGIPAGVGVWWLILFTRSNVALAFTQPAPAQMTIDASGFPQPTVPVIASPPNRASCPLPLAILAGLLVFGGAFVLLFIFLPLPHDAPLFFLGHAFVGPSVKIIYLIFGLVSVISGVGILKLKPWALYTQIAVQILGVLNCAIAALSPRYPSIMRSMIQKMYPDNPMLTAGSPFMSDSYFRSLMLVSALVILVFLAILLWQRSRFLGQARAGSAQS